jgi:hypothetical protein
MHPSPATRKVSGALGLGAMLAAAALAAEPAPAPPTEPPRAAADQEASAPSCPRGGLYPVCRRVPLKKKKPHVEYQMKCEPVCVPGAGLLGGCSTGCGCGTTTIREKKSLLKKTTEQEVDSYEYKLVWVCRACAFGDGCRPRAEVPPRWEASP